MKCIEASSKDYHRIKTINPGFMSEQKFLGTIQLFTVLLLEEDCEPIGYAIISELDSYVAIEEFFIKPSAREKGKGRAFYEKIEEYMKAKNIKYIKLLSTSFGSARFWRKMGFNTYYEGVYNHIKEIS